MDKFHVGFFFLNGHSVEPLILFPNVRFLNQNKKHISISLQFLWVMSELFRTHVIVSSMGIESSYVSNGLVHSSAPRSMSLHGDPLR